MQIFQDLDEWLYVRRSLSETKTIGFVPTMGNLHAGHASLLTISKQNNALTVVSIFINPTQFNQRDDFKKYPRTLEADLELLQQANIDYCILPTERAIYHDDYHYAIEENTLCQIMEGKQRPGHFKGVLTIVMKLLNLIRPHTAYFGEKDYQQYLLIRNMVQAFFMNTKIQSCPTIRRPSGLPYSSRNSRLTPYARLIADKFATIFHQNKKSCVLIIQELQEAGITVEYIIDNDNRRFAAVVIDGIRLIDNYELCT